MPFSERTHNGEEDEGKAPLRIGVRSREGLGIEKAGVMACSMPPWSSRNRENSEPEHRIGLVGWAIKRTTLFIVGGNQSLGRSGRFGQTAPERDRREGTRSRSNRTALLVHGYLLSMTEDGEERKETTGERHLTTSSSYRLGEYGTTAGGQGRASKNELNGGHVVVLSYHRSSNNTYLGKYIPLIPTLLQLSQALSPGEIRDGTKDFTSSIVRSSVKGTEGERRSDADDG